MTRITELPSDQLEYEGGRYGPDHFGDNDDGDAILVGERRAMENGCGNTTEGRIESASNQVMRIVIGIGEVPVKSNRRPDNRLPSTSQAGARSPWRANNGSSHRFTQKGFQP